MPKVQALLYSILFSYLTFLACTPKLSTQPSVWGVVLDFPFKITFAVVKEVPMMVGHPVQLPSSSTAEEHVFFCRFIARYVGVL